jgi:hypothetical protein
MSDTPKTRWTAGILAGLPRAVVDVAGVTRCAVCGHPADAPDRCTHMARIGQYTGPGPDPSPPAPAPADLAEVRAGVARVKAEMASETEGAAVRRRIRNEDAAALRYALETPLPRPYDEAMRRNGTTPNPEPEPIDPMNPWTTALKQQMQEAHR